MADGPLDLGWHEVRLECPDCHDLAVTGVELVTVRSRATGEAVTLRLKVKAAKLIHNCGQGRFDLGGPDNA